MSEAEGGTKIARKPKIVEQQVATPQQQIPQQQQIPVQYQQQQQIPVQYQQQQQIPQQQQQIPQQQQRLPMQQQFPVQQTKIINEGSSNNKLSKLGSLYGNGRIKNVIVVFVIFILLNSKLFWKQLMKLPFMGTVEPSILALIVNSIIAALAFYLLNIFT